MDPEESGGITRKNKIINFLNFQTNFKFPRCLKSSLSLLCRAE